MNNNGNGHLPGQFPPARHLRSGRGVKQAEQAAWLQRFAFDSAVALRNGCTEAETGKLVMTPVMAKAVKELLCAWDVAADRLRVLRGKGLPASVRAKTGSTRQPEPIEPA